MTSRGWSFSRREHTLSTGHHYTLDNTKILVKEDKWFPRKIQEALHIHKRSAALRRDHEIPPILLQLLPCDHQVMWPATLPSKQSMWHGRSVWYVSTLFLRDIFIFTSWDLLLKLPSITGGGSEDRGHAWSKMRVHQVHLIIDRLNCSLIDWRTGNRNFFTLMDYMFFASKKLKNEEHSRVHTRIWASGIGMTVCVFGMPFHWGCYNRSASPPCQDSSMWSPRPQHHPSHGPLGCISHNLTVQWVFWWLGSIYYL